MKRIIALIVILIFAVSILASCEAVEPEMQDIEKPEAVTPEEPVEEIPEVEEEPIEVKAQALYDGVYILYGTANRGDVLTLTDESDKCYVTEINGIQVLIEKKNIRLESQEAASAWEGKADSDITMYPTAYLEGEGQIVSEGTVLTVEDEFSGVYYITYKDDNGTEYKGYVSSGSDISNNAKAEKKSSSSKKSSSGSSDKSESKPAEKKEPAPEPDPEPKEEPKPNTDSESSGDAEDINLDNISADFSDDYGIVLLAGTYEAAEAGELDVSDEDIAPAVQESNEGIEQPAGIEGIEEEIQEEGFVQQTGTVFSDGSEIYLATTVKGEEYVLADGESALNTLPDDDVSIIYGENTGTVKRWALKFDGDPDYEEWPAKAIADIYPFDNGLGRGKGIEIPAETVFTIIGDTGTYYVMLTEDGRILYLTKEGSEEYIKKYDQAAIEEEQRLTEEAKAKEEAKSSKKSSSSSGSKSSSDSSDSKPKEESKTEPAPENKSDSSGSSGESETVVDDSSEYTAPIL